jgi:two-component system, OmpR family, phosphate regulon sensor histidine kinase PhoR
MTVFWFLCGLGVGLFLWADYSRRLNRRIAAVLQLLSGESLSVRDASWGRLTRLVDQQRQTQRDLRRQLDEWRHTLQSAPIGYLEVDGADQLYWHNFKARELLKIELPLQMVSGRMLLQVVRSLELEQLIKDVRQSQTPQEQDWNLYAPPTNDAPAAAALIPLRGFGLPLSDLHVGVFLESRQEATTLAQERDRWASDVAHELKTPLTSIRLMIETLQGQINPSLHIWTERLLKETTRLSNLVQDLLELSHVSRQATDILCLSAVDLPALVRSAWLNLEPLAQQKNLVLYYQGPEHFVCQADEARLYRVLVNVVDNGIRHSPADQALMIEVSTEAQLQNGTPEPDAVWIIIDVIDSGAGFPASAIAHVFKRFFRVDASRVRATEPVQAQDAVTASTGGGSGLGLAIVEQIIAAHGGSVEARNHPQTGGGWVRIRLPHTS